VARNIELRALACAIGLVALLFGSAPTGAAEPNDSDTGLRVPRFVSLHSDKVNLRTGPGRQYPIEWVLTRKDMPVEVVAQFEHWRRIRHWDGTIGWVQEHMITGKRYVIVAKGAVRPVYREPDSAGPLAARAEPGVVARLIECKGAWCRVDAGEASGWMRRADLWGVYPDESVP
jgi:SH3-like domain-containing protein